MNKRFFRIFLCLMCALLVFCSCGIENSTNTESLKESEKDRNTEEKGDTYISPVDFDGLKKQCEDVYAWLSIENTEVSYPVVNRPGDNGYYLRRDLDGNYSFDGTLFTEDYNKRDFSDKVTIIYGHSMPSGKMFGSLEKSYSDREFFESHRNITVYLPKTEKHYKVVAAVPYKNVHLLYYYDFSVESIFYAVMEDIFSVRALNGVTEDNYSPCFDDSYIILSTCLLGNSQKRYLVIAVEDKK